jgi:sec-independent protein translocase protein TatA
MPMNIGPMEIVIVLIVALVVFGPKRLPELGGSLGRSMREFKSSITGERDEDDKRPGLAAPNATPATGVQAVDVEVVHENSA